LSGLLKQRLRRPDQHLHPNLNLTLSKHLRRSQLKCLHGLSK
jgi:hypothetical protein